MNQAIDIFALPQSHKKLNSTARSTVSKNVSGNRSFMQGILIHNSSKMNTSSSSAMVLKSRQFMEITLGPFSSAAATCDYCFSSFTKEGNAPAGPVAPACVCMAYPIDGSFNMFCATPVSAAGYIKDKGGCRCQARDMEAMGSTTCKAIEWSELKRHESIRRHCLKRNYLASMRERERERKCSETHNVVTQPLVNPCRSRDSGGSEQFLK